MGTIAALTLQDAETTPVDHVFTPISCTGSRAVLVNKASTTPMGREKLIFDFSPPTPNRSTYKPKISFSFPIEYVDANGNTQVKDIARAEISYVIPASLTDQERANFSALVRDVQTEAKVKAYVDDLDPYY